MKIWDTGYSARHQFQVITDEEIPGYDNLRSLTDAINASSRDGVELLLPAGTILVSDTIVSTESRFFITGSASGTTIKCTDDTKDVMVLGPGEVGSGTTIGGYINNFHIEGPTASQGPSTMSKGLVLNGLRHAIVSNIMVKYTQVGYDMINNCWGTQFQNVRTSYQYCRAGITLRGQEGAVWGSGSDIPFVGCWFHGMDGGIWIHRNGGGYHFKGGQVAGGFNLSGANDLLGSVVIGKNYYNQTEVGAVGNVDFDGVDFENTRHMWKIRGFGRAMVEFANCSFLATENTNKALGLIKLDGAENGSWIFNNATVNGQYAGAALMVVAAQGSAFAIPDYHTQFGYGCYANSVQVTTGATLNSQSNLNIGMSIGRVAGNPFLALGKGRFRWLDSTGHFEVAKNHGGTDGNTGFFPMLQQVAVPALATSTGQIGDFAFDASFLYICHAVNTWKRVGIATW